MKTKDKVNKAKVQWIYSFFNDRKCEIKEYILKTKVQRNQRELLKLRDYILRDIGFEDREKLKKLLK